MRQVIPQSLRGTAYLALLLVCFLLPVHAVAHDHQGDGDHGGTVVEQCLFCQVSSPKPLPVPGRGELLPVFIAHSVCLEIDHDFDFALQRFRDHAIPARGPPLNA